MNDIDYFRKIFACLDKEESITHNELIMLLQQAGCTASHEITRLIENFPRETKRTIFDTSTIPPQPYNAPFDVEVAITPDGKIYKKRIPAVSQR